MSYENLFDDSITRYMKLDENFNLKMDELDPIVVKNC